MKKLLFILLLLISFNVYAIEVKYTIDGFYVDSTILENGDLLVKEVIVQRGSFNGYNRDIFYEGSTTVDRQYAATSIELIKICKSNLTTFEATSNPVDCFSQVEYASLGDINKYEVYRYYNGVGYKMYNYTNNSYTTYYIEYILKDVAIKYNDIGEIRWNFIPDRFKDLIKNIEVRVNLNKDQKTLRVWSHGPLYVENNILDKNTINIVATDLPKETPVDIRMAFDADYLENNSKVESTNRLDKILE
jgi:hypothetical protein